MSEDEHRAPDTGRFRKGRSGNPSGRPKRQRETPAASAFSIILDRTLTMTREGEPTEVSIEEALLQRTYQDALAGKRLAIRKVLAWIERREQWLAKRGDRQTNRPIVTWRDVYDPDNADEALLILGVAGIDPNQSGRYDDRPRLVLEPWAIDAALRRGKDLALTREDIHCIRHCSRPEAGALLDAVRVDE